MILRSSCAGEAVSLMAQIAAYWVLGAMLSAVLVARLFALVNRFDNRTVVRLRPL